MSRLFILVFLQACAGSPVDETDLGELPVDEYPEELRDPIDAEAGYYRGAPVFVYDLGAVAVRRNPEGEFAGGRVNEMYVFCEDVTPAAEPTSSPTCEGPLYEVNESRYEIPIIEGQYPVVDEEPSSETYSPYWELVYVEASSELESGDIKSAETLFLRTDLDRTPSGKIVHCAMIEPTIPEIPEGAHGIALVQLWYQKYLAVCLLLEGGSHLLGDAGLPPVGGLRVDVGDETVWTVPAVDAFFPEVRIWDREVPVPGNILVDVAVDDPDGRYTPLVRVNEIRVLWDYQVGSFDDVADVDDSIIELRSPEEHRDLPIVSGAGR